MDHDSLAGAKEFVDAGRIAGMPTTIGYEIRTDWSDYQNRRPAHQ